MNLLKLFNIKTEDNIVTELPQENFTIEKLEKYRSKDRDELDLILDSLFYENYKKWQNDNYKIEGEELVRYDSIIELLDEICIISIGKRNTLINSHYEEIFKEYNVCKNEVIYLAGGNGINNDVRNYIVDNFYHDLLIPKTFSKYVKHFKQNPKSLENWFYRLIEKNIYYTDARSLVTNLKKLKSPYLTEKMLEFYIIVSKDFSIKVNRNLTNSNEDQVFYQYKTFYESWLEFLIEEKSNQVYPIQQLEVTIMEKFEDVITKFGITNNYTIDDEYILESVIREIPTVGVILHEYTHSKNRESIFLGVSSVELSVFEAAFSKPSEKSCYFTASRKMFLNNLMQFIGNVFSHVIFKETEELEASVNSYVSFIDSKYSINSDYCLKKEYEVLLEMLSNISKVDNNKLLHKVSIENYYGPTMYVCSLLEKTLRNFYMFMRIDIDYNQAKNITLNYLLSEENREIIDLLGKEQSLVLKYYLLYDNHNQGLNIRNNLAHLDFDIDEKDIYVTFITSVVLLFSVVSSIVLYDNEI